MTGGSSAWLSVASVTVSASGSTDSLAGVAGYESETSTDSGATWSSPALRPRPLTIAAEGETLVRFRAVDVAGNVSGLGGGHGSHRPYAPPPTPRSRERRQPRPLQSLASITIAGLRLQRRAASGVSRVNQFETSTDGGATWSAPRRRARR